MAENDALAAFRREALAALAHVAAMLTADNLQADVDMLRRAINALQLELPGDVAADVRARIEAVLGNAAYLFVKLCALIEQAKAIGFDPARPDGGIQQLVAKAASAEACLKYLDEHWGVDLFFARRPGQVLIYDGPLSSEHTELRSRGATLREAVAPLLRAK